MTEAHTYSLSTAENELGVVVAHSPEGWFIYIYVNYCVVEFIDFIHWV